MKKILYVLLLSGCCHQICCPPIPKPTLDVYTIPKGRHYSDVDDKEYFTDNHRLIFIVQFDSSCIYTSRLPENQGDINKVYGFSDCSSHHQNNSARIGWNWTRDSLRLHAYVYSGNQRIFQEITAINIGEKVYCQIAIVDSSYVFTVGDITTKIKRDCIGEYRHYLLFPYFGGNEVAPHEITIKIKNLN